MVTEFLPCLAACLYCWVNVSHEIKPNYPNRAKWRENCLSINETS